MRFSSSKLFHVPVWSCWISGGLGCPGTLDGTRFPLKGRGKSDDKFPQLIKKPHFNNIAELLN